MACSTCIALHLVEPSLKQLVGADYLKDSSLTLTVFAPTNDAWVKRLPTLTRANGITVSDLFSESKSAALQNMLQYHILNQPRTVSKRKVSQRIE